MVILTEHWSIPDNKNNPPLVFRHSLIAILDYHERDPNEVPMIPSRVPITNLGVVSDNLSHQRQRKLTGVPKREGELSRVRSPTKSQWSPTESQLGGWARHLAIIMLMKPFITLSCRSNYISPRWPFCDEFLYIYIASLARAYLSFQLS